MSLSIDMALDKIAISALYLKTERHSRQASAPRLVIRLLGQFAHSVYQTGWAIFYSLSLFRLRRRKLSMSMISRMTVSAKSRISYKLIACLPKLIIQPCGRSSFRGQIRPCREYQI